MRNQEGKIELQKKVHRRTGVRDITFWATHPPTCAIFADFFAYFLPFVYSDFKWKNFFLLQNGGGGWCTPPPPAPSLCSRSVYGPGKIYEISK